MKSRNVTTYLAVLVVLFALVSGCSEKEEAPPIEEEAAIETEAQAVEPQTSDATPAPLMQRFLAGPAGLLKVSTQDPIAKSFAVWGLSIRNHPRRPMDIHFEVELEQETFQKDHAQKGKTSRAFLDDVCQENDLVWTLAGPNTIRISRKAK